MEDKLELSDGSIWIMQDIKKVFQELYDHYRAVVNRNEYLQSENERLKSESYKDEQLMMMKKKYTAMKEKCYNGFPINKEDSEKINKWQEEIMEKYPGTGGPIGGRFKYEFIPTGVGTFGTVIDSISGEKLNFDDLF